MKQNNFVAKHMNKFNKCEAHEPKQGKHVKRHKSKRDWKKEVKDLSIC